MAARTAKGLPFAGIHGPWEGAVGASEAQSLAEAKKRNTAKLRILAWNVQGGLGQAGGLEASLNKMRSLVSLLAGRGAVLGLCAWWLVRVG